MPQELKRTRGRRNEQSSKRRRVQNDDQTDENFIRLDVGVEENEAASERPFYGMLEDEEQEYFRHADEMLEVNNFPDEEQRSLFLASVYREAENKELKIACSQSCSRLMERLILLSTAEQKKKLFESFAGHFPHLIQHRFASHCCETLFIQSAPAVTEELVTTSKKQTSEGKLESMENLFLQTLDELEDKMSSLLTDRFASHTLRVLLTVLDGRPLSESSSKSLLQSKRKEHITISNVQPSSTPLLSKKRSVPPSFTHAVEKIISDIVMTMDTSFLRVLATHPTGNPTLQLLLEIELANSKSNRDNPTEKTILSSLLPDALDVENSESLVLINGLLYDPIGSRLLETICQYVPGKLFKQIYQLVFKDRIAAIVRNEISSYAAIRVLSRISKQDLEDALKLITPQISGLVERNRTLIIKTLVERCHARGADTTELIAAISLAYSKCPETLIVKMASLDISAIVSAVVFPQDGEPDASTPPQLKSTPAQLHGSLLVQSLLMLPGPPTELIQTALLSLPPRILQALSMYTTTSHIVQTALSPLLSVPFRRKLIHNLMFPPNDSKDKHPMALTLALSSTGSHVLDALLVSTASSLSSTLVSQTGGSTPLFSCAERIASILVSHENAIRDSFFGRFVWRNWSLDLFKRARSDWVKKVKSTPVPEFMGPAANPICSPEVDAEKTMNVSKSKNQRKKIKPTKDQSTRASGKSAIEMARAKFAAAKAANGANSTRVAAKATGANARKIGL
ncbi:Nucleolar protein 9 [Podosphaera aphanis]|nr:Nucleolar protein 9 [Podosphaera aphanis]